MSFSSYFLSPCGPLGLAQLEQFTQLHSCLVQLRFTVADGTAHHLGNFIVFVAFHVVQYKHETVSRRQTLDSALQGNTIDGASKHVVAHAEVPLRSIVLLRLEGFLERNHGQTSLAQ